jgi:hypothetical protein
MNQEYLSIKSKERDRLENMQIERELNCSNLAIRRREKRTGRRRCSGSTVMTMVAGELLASPDLTLVWS